MKKIYLIILLILVIVLAAVNFYIYFYLKPEKPPEIVTRSNTHIRDNVTTFDFVPLGPHLIQNPDGSLSLASNIWKSSNWLPFGMGVTKDGKHNITYHGGFRIHQVNYKVSVDGSDWITGAYGTKVYYDETGSEFGTGFPTVYAKGKNYYAYMAYDENTRTWYYELNSPDGYINATAIARSVPFWLGKAGGPYIVQGLHDEVEDLDIWGGYVDMADVVTESNFGGVKRTYYGDMAMDREYHRRLYGRTPLGKGSPYKFSAMSFHDETNEIDMAILQAINPIDGSDNYKGLPFEHQARINFYRRGEDFTFNDFQYSDDGSIPMQIVHIKGPYEGGYIDLTAKTFQTWGWWPRKGTWWDTDAIRYWGRTFVLWNGEITLDGEIIEVKDAFGFGEFTRVEKPHEINKMLKALDRTYEYMRERGFTNEFTASSYVLGKKWLGLEIPNPEEIVAYLDQRQAENKWHDGGWMPLWPEGLRWYMSRVVLYTYFLLDAKPAMSCDEFLALLEDWDVVLAYARNHEDPWTGVSYPGDFRDVYHMLFSYASYYKRFPWWIDDDSPLWRDYLERDQRVIEEWTIANGTQVHRRSHIGFTYGLLHRPFPNAENMLQDIADYPAGPLNLWTLAELKCNNPELDPKTIDELMQSKHYQEMILSNYREQIIDGEIYGFFDWGVAGPTHPSVKFPPSQWTSWKDERDFWVSNTHRAAAAVMSGLLPGNVDPCFNKLYEAIEK